MKTKVFALIASLAFAGAASAATLDFTTNTYASTFGPNVATDSIDGVNFTITATARGVNGFRQGGAGGLSFGVPGNGMYSIAIVADKDVEYNSMYGNGHSLTAFAGQLPFDIDVEGSEVSGGNMFADTSLQTVAFGDGPISVAAGETFFFHVDFDALIGSSIYASALVKSFDFSVDQAPAVPLPAGMPLLLAGLGGLAVLRRRKS